MESELRSLIHLMVARHATDAHLTLRFGRLTLRLRCPERMIDDDSGMFDGRLLHYLKYISHLDLGAMSTPQSGSFTRQYQDRLLQFRFACLGTQQLQTGVLRLLNLQDLTRIEEICNDADKRALFHALCHQRHGLVRMHTPRTNCCAILPIIQAIQAKFRRFSFGISGTFHQLINNPLLLRYL